MWRLTVWYNECSDSNWTEFSSPLSSPSHLVRQINNTHSTLLEITNTSSMSHDVTPDTREQGLSPHEVTPTLSQPCRGSLCVYAHIPKQSHTHLSSVSVTASYYRPQSLNLLHTPHNTTIPGASMVTHQWATVPSQLQMYNSIRKQREKKEKSDWTEWNKKKGKWGSEHHRSLLLLSWWLQDLGRIIKYFI